MRFGVRVRHGLVLAALVVGGVLVVAEEEQRPNFIFILSDDQGWSQVSCPMDPDVPKAASSYFEMPSQERLASGGMRFSSGYSPAPSCTPSRRSILCGMTPARQRGTGAQSEFDWSGRLTIPRVLKRADASYRSAHFGKLGGLGGVTPEEIGFDEDDGATLNETGGMPKDMTERGITVIKDDPKLVDSLTQRAIGFMERQVEQGHPFYLQVSHYAPHLQIQARQTSIEKYREKGEPDRAVTHGFAAMLEDMDRAVGDVLDAVERLEIADRTYVFYMSDNGGRHAIPGADDSMEPPNRPLNGSKHSLYEGGIRVPFIVAGPGVRARSISRVPVTGYDLLPTLYDLAGGRDPLPSEIDGGSLRTVLENGGSGRVERGLEGLIFHNPLHTSNPQSAIRVGDYKLLIDWQEGERPRVDRLFDLRGDVEEQRDLSVSMREKAGQLERVLLDYLQDVDAESPEGGTK
jgi:arylsulfatase A-like enzyme